jgi:hypothetical protein
MTNIVPLVQPEVQAADDELNRRISRYNEELERLSAEGRTLRDSKIAVTVQETHAADKRQKTQLNSEKRQLDAEIKRNRAAQESLQEQLDSAETDLARLRGARNQVYTKQNSEATAKKVFDDNNIHYVIYDQQWWSVDSTGSRMDIKINRSETGVIKDLIFDDSSWVIRDEQELKSLAKSMNRMYKHIVRDFAPARPGVYNQMNDIRKNWLQPTHGVEPHEAFRVLTLSIAGGNSEYADQLERYVAYRYCHPEDVMIPNIDSCATGGTGRDTFWNMISTIFTNECCGSAGEETFKGTHNGDLFGKMFIKIDEKDSARVPIDKLKEYTGGSMYRDRQMNSNARDAVRLFSFMMFRNGYTTTARLAGTGSTGEDRRWEPIIARLNLNKHAALHFGLIDNINQALTDEQARAVQIAIKDWQRDVYKNEQAIAAALGAWIDRYQTRTMTELLPIHGVYYTEMLERQKRGIDGFMPKFMRLWAAGHSTVICVRDAHRLYTVSESADVKKDWFKNQMLYWLNSRQGWDAEERTDQVYLSEGGTVRSMFAHIYDRLAQPAQRVWDLEDFIDAEARDDKNLPVGRKITIYSVRDELK